MMTAAAPHPLVADYLRRLREEGARLPADQAAELVADIEAHLDEALEDAAGDAKVRDTLDRLGSPTELVTAATEPRSGPVAGATGAGATATAVRSARVEVAAAGCLIGAAVLFPVWFVSGPLWLVGLVLLAWSRRWTIREKFLALASWGTMFPLAVLVVGGAGLLAWWQVQDEGGVTVIGEDVGVGEPGAMPSGEAAGPWWAVIILGVLVLYLVFVVWASIKLVRAARR